ncbi:NAD-dependent epimerase/dehydratase family protein [Periweissella fabalis]|uniref:NAD(P)-dependent oxidoreductase n=1 Tax=Periweissella fabalis TaxID=1070421 RepID=A0A7X6N296_9LACO|nr:NAD(P)-dependent oxidoreductase [Periweissella fabalis]MCM0599758.1 NAD(P)-dependent oxidoreductase [Periweissella fabalis]NKZ24436.1 NAD(P)-dependent oxidoreductase [Periweissella fabalis]
MQRIFITGATGLIGFQLGKALLKLGYEVGGLTTSEHGVQRLDAAGITAFKGDILVYDDVKAALVTFKPTVIMHQVTALKDGSSAANAHVRTIGTRNLVQAAQLVGVKQIIAQSIAWSYAPGDNLATEETPLDITAPAPRQTTVNGILALEKAVKTLPLWTILRYGTLYGPGTWYDQGNLINQQMAAGELTLSLGITSFIHINDAVQAAMQALTLPQGVYNIVDNQPMANETWSQLYAQVMHSPQAPSFIPAQPFERGVSNAKWLANGGQLQYPTFAQGVVNHEARH